MVEYQGSERPWMKQPLGEPAVLSVDSQAVGPPSDT